MISPFLIVQPTPSCRASLVVRLGGVGENVVPHYRERKVPSAKLDPLQRRRRTPLKRLTSPCSPNTPLDLEGLIDEIAVALLAPLSSTSSRGGEGVRRRRVGHESGSMAVHGGRRNRGDDGVQVVVQMNRDGGLGMSSGQATWLGLRTLEPVLLVLQFRPSRQMVVRRRRSRERRHPTRRICRSDDGGGLLGGVLRAEIVDVVAFLLEFLVVEVLFLVLLILFVAKVLLRPLGSRTRSIFPGVLARRARLLVPLFLLRSLDAAHGRLKPYENDKGGLLLALVPAQRARDGVEPIVGLLVRAYGREGVRARRDLDMISLFRQNVSIQHRGRSKSTHVAARLARVHRTKPTPCCAN